MPIALPGDAMLGVSEAENRHAASPKQTGDDLDEGLRSGGSGYAFRISGAIANRSYAP
jgi:hypothetical protein